MVKNIVRCVERFLCKKLKINYQILIIFSLICLVVSYKTGLKHDYRQYIGQWMLVLSNDDPWRTNNAYGPLHNIFAYLLPISNLAPKVLIVGFFLLAHGLLIYEISDRNWREISLGYFLSIPANFLFIGVVVIYGLNDSFVAAILVLSILARNKRFMGVSGGLVGLAALVKFYPVLLLPFFALDDRKISIKLLSWGGFVFFLGMCIGYALWGASVFSPILFGAERGPKLMSVIAALRSLLGDTDIVLFLIKFNSAFVIVGVTLAFFAVRKIDLNWLPSAVIGYFVVLTLYKVGHQQFYLPLISMVSALPLVKDRDARFLLVCMIPFVLCVSIYQFGFQFGSDQYREKLGWVGSYGGFFFFLVSILTLSLFFRMRKSRH